MALEFPWIPAATVALSLKFTECFENNALVLYLLYSGNPERINEEINLICN